MSASSHNYSLMTQLFAKILGRTRKSLKTAQLKVEIEEGRFLQISGERNVEENKNDKWHRVERRRGKFLRRFWLLENAKVDEVKAAMENGVLTVTIPKTEEKKPQVKYIEITS